MAKTHSSETQRCSNCRRVRVPKNVGMCQGCRERAQRDAQVQFSYPRTRKLSRPLGEGEGP